MAQRRAVERATASGAFDDVTTTRPPNFDRIVDAHLAAEFAELERLVPVMGHGDLLIPRHEVPRPRLGAGDAWSPPCCAGSRCSAGRVLAGRVTDLVVADGRCHGVRLVTQGACATALAGDVVIASGGISGLFGDGGTGGTGLLLGTCARAGVALDNLEMFHRFALGDLTHRRPLYPFDVHGARLLRDGRPATDLADLLRTTPPQRVDLAAWRSYWVRHQASRTPPSWRPGRSGWARSAGSAPGVCPSPPRTAACAACT